MNPTQPMSDAPQPAVQYVSRLPIPTGASEHVKFDVPETSLLAHLIAKLDEAYGYVDSLGAFPAGRTTQISVTLHRQFVQGIADRFAQAVEALHIVAHDRDNRLAQLTNARGDAETLSLLKRTCAEREERIAQLQHELQNAHMHIDSDHDLSRQLIAECERLKMQLSAKQRELEAQGRLVAGYEATREEMAARVRSALRERDAANAAAVRAHDDSTLLLQLDATRDELREIAAQLRETSAERDELRDGVAPLNAVIRTLGAEIERLQTNNAELTGQQPF